MSFPAIASPSVRRTVREDTTWYETFVELIRAELSPYPGRALTVARIVLACTIVMLWVEVFRIPGGIWGAYYPLLVSRDNLRATRRSAFWIATITAIGTVEVVLGAMLFLGSPLLHFLWVCASLWGVFYLISSLRVYETGLALGLFLATSITIWDLPISASRRLEQTLYTSLSILVGCAVTILVEYLFSHTHEPDAVLEGIEQRLAVTSRVLDHYANPESPHRDVAYEAKRYSMRGTGDLRELISQVAYPMAERQRLSTALALSGRLVDLSWSLAESERSMASADLELCQLIHQKVDLLRDRLLKEELAEWIDIVEVPTTSIPVFAEMERTIDLLAESLSPSGWRDLPPSLSREHSGMNNDLFQPDAFSSVGHLRFAVRGSLSALACYLVYMSVGWTTLGASIATCILTALPVTGAARHKQLMRFTGVLIGACALGFTTQIFILPQIDSIFSYLLLFACIVAMGAWIATSTPRLAYTGAQMVLAYELVNLNQFSLNPSLVSARDACLGIVLGIGAMWLFFDHLWATSSRESLKGLFAAAFQDIAAVHIPPDQDGVARPVKSLEGQVDQIMRNFEKIGSTIDVSLFETHPASASEEFLLREAKKWLSELRSALLLTTGLIHHQALWREHDESNLVARTQAYLSEVLAQSAQRIEGGAHEERVLQSSSNSSLREELYSNLGLSVQRGSMKKLMEARLCVSLFAVVCNLANAVNKSP